MLSASRFSALALLAFSSLTQARPIPHTVSLFRRAVLNANEGYLVVQNKDAPKGYSDALEPYDHYHFRYMAIGCSDVSKETQFFDTCCQPRQVGKQSDDKYPAACQLATYLVFDPDYAGDKVVAKLGSLRAYEKKIGYEDKDVKDHKTESSSKSAISSQTPENTSSEWVPQPASSSSSSSQWTSSSSQKTWTPEAKPSSGSSQWALESSSPQWTSSSSEWTPQAAPSSSSSSQAWSEAASSSSYQAPAPAPSSSAASSNNNAGSSSGDFTGQASWFTQNGNPGACGIYHSDADHIVALQQDMYGNLGQQSQYCGRSLTITNTATGATAQAVVADACPGCATYHSLDLSTGLFQALGNLDQGILPISWHFN